jgi:hypothetical protein
MKTHSTFLEHASADATSPDRILRIALAAWKQGNFVEVLDQFNDRFIFTDHALGLQFEDKDRLTEYLSTIRERLPNPGRRANTIYNSGDVVISEWTLTLTQTEPFVDGRLREVPSCVRGISVVRIDNGKVSQWSDYYDQLKFIALMITPPALAETHNSHQPTAFKRS